MKLMLFADCKDRLASISNKSPRDHLIEPTKFVFSFSADVPPACVVEPGDILEATTQDASNGNIRSAQDLPSSSAKRPWVNPLTGPIIINGAEPGDALVVETLSIEPLGKRGFSWSRADLGALVGTSTTAILNPPLEERVWIYEIRANEVVSSIQSRKREIILPYKPFLGTIGSTPLGEAPHSTIPGRYGGNMDAVENGVGSYLILPVFVLGAYLYFGDAHAVQGDGELCGTAVEMPARVRLRIDLIKGKTVRWPMIETADAIMAVGSAKPLEDAYRIACKEIILWLNEEQGFDFFNAYQLTSQTVSCRIGNVVNPAYSVVACLRKQVLKERDHI